MFTKDKAQRFAKQYGWTIEDAKRAYGDLDLKNATEQDLLMALVKFAGTELLNRQRLQARQKGEVKTKRKELAEAEEKLEAHLVETQQKLLEMRSRFLPVIKRLYWFAKPFGLSDPWIEAILKTYEDYQDSLGQPPAA